MIIQVFNNRNHKNQRYLTSFISSLVELKEDIIVWYNSDPIKYSPFQLLNYKSLKLFAEFLRFCLSESVKLKKAVRWYFKYKNVLNQPINTLIHIHEIHSLPLLILKFLKENKGYKIIVSLRGRDILVNPIFVDKKEELINKLFYVDKVHCISVHIQNKLLKLFPEIESYVLNRSLILNLDKKDRITRGNPIKLLSIGRLVWEKGHFYLIDSVYRLSERGVKLTLDIYGEGPCFEFLTYMIKERGLENIIILKGFVQMDNNSDLLKEYDLFIHPSVSEGLGNSILDAIAANIPVLCADGNGSNDIIFNEINGILFNLSRYEELDSGILSYDSRINFNRMSELNRKIENELSLENEINCHFDQYKTLLF